MRRAFSRIAPATSPSGRSNGTGGRKCATWLPPRPTRCRKMGSTAARARSAIFTGPSRVQARRPKNGTKTPSSSRRILVVEDRDGLAAGERAQRRARRIAACQELGPAGAAVAPDHGVEERALARLLHRHEGEAVRGHGGGEHLPGAEVAGNGEHTSALRARARRLVVLDAFDAHALPQRIGPEPPEQRKLRCALAHVLERADEYGLAGCLAPLRKRETKIYAGNLGPRAAAAEPRSRPRPAPRASARCSGKRSKSQSSRSTIATAARSRRVGDGAGIAGCSAGARSPPSPLAAAIAAREASSGRRDGRRGPPGIVTTRRGFAGSGSPRARAPRRSAWACAR